MPTPIATPQGAATIGLGNAAMVRRKRNTGLSSPEGGLATKSCRSLPAVKHSALPCRSATRSAGSAAAASSASAMAAYIAAVIAFLRSGRAKEMAAMPPAVLNWMDMSDAVLEEKSESGCDAAGAPCRCGAYTADSPPSTGYTPPVQKPERSETRNTTRLATSATVP